MDIAARLGGITKPGAGKECVLTFVHQAIRSSPVKCRAGEKNRERLSTRCLEGWVSADELPGGGRIPTGTQRCSSLCEWRDGSGSGRRRGSAPGPAYLC